MDVSPILQDCAAAVVDDSFLRCFQSRPPEPWDWNIFMLPTHYIGMAFRWLILFPLRLIAAVLSWLLFLALFFTVPYALKVLPHAPCLCCIASSRPPQLWLQWCSDPSLHFISLFGGR